MNAIENIKSYNISDLFTLYGIELKKAGKDFKCNCLFHTENTPSFVVSDAKGIYNCFGCRESGDVIRFSEKKELLTTAEAVKYITEKMLNDTYQAKAPEKQKRAKIDFNGITLTFDYNAAIVSDCKSLSFRFDKTTVKWNLSIDDYKSKYDEVNRI